MNLKEKNYLALQILEQFTNSRQGFYVAETTYSGREF